MTENRSTNRWMRFAQQVADVAAVARVRYGEQLDQERLRPGVAAADDRRRTTAGEYPVVSPRLSIAADQEPAHSLDHPLSPGSSEGSAKHAESREKIGDAGARPVLSEPASPPEPCRDHLVPQGAVATLKELFRRFGKDQCPAYAAALSFFSILAIIPLLVVALAGLAFFIQDPAQAMQHLQKFIAQLLPGKYAGDAAREIMREANIQKSVEGLIQTRGMAGVIGLLSLIWASMQIFVNGSPAMNAAFEVEEKRSWLKLRLVAFGLLLGAGALFLASLLPSAGPAFIRTLHIPWLGLPEHPPWYIDALFWLAALALNSMMFALIYRFLPNAPISWRQALVGGLVSGLLWEAAKQGFSAYLAHFNSYNKVYGALGGLIVLVLWIYYTSMILLLGAEASSLYRDMREAARGDEPAASAARLALVAPGRRARARSTH